MPGFPDQKDQLVTSAKLIKSSLPWELWLSMFQLSWKKKKNLNLNTGDSECPTQVLLEPTLRNYELTSFIYRPFSIVSLSLTMQNHLEYVDMD